mgnify:CR=1 FL=1
MANNSNSFSAVEANKNLLHPDLFNLPPNRPVPVNLMPNVINTRQLLYNLTRGNGRFNFTSQEPLVMPPSIPSNVNVVNNYAAIKMVAEDMTKNLGSEVTQRKLCHWLLARNIIPANQLPALKMRNRSYTTNYSPLNPSGLTSADQAHFSINYGSITQLPNVNAKEPVITRNGVLEYISIPAEHATKTCPCPGPQASNNFPRLLFGLVCKPAEIVDYSQAKNSTKDIHPMDTPGAHREMMSPSHAFFSKISKEGTIVPQLIRRTPVSQLHRTKPIIYKPPFSGLNLLSLPGYAASLATHLNRTEFDAHIENFSQPHGDTGDITNKYRWHPLDPKVLNPDLSASGAVNVEDLLINAALAQPYDGPLYCVFCDTNLDITQMSEVITHLYEEHLSLLASLFTCPACFGVTVVSPETWADHWYTTHARTIALMPVLNETHLGHRLQMGVALDAFLTMASLTSLTADPPASGFVTMHGGFAPPDTNTLEQRIKDLRKQALPPRYHVAAAAAAQAAAQIGGRRPRVAQVEVRARHGAELRVSRQQMRAGAGDHHPHQ